MPLLCPFYCYYLNTTMKIEGNENKQINDYYGWNISIVFWHMFSFDCFQIRSQYPFSCARYE